MTKTAQISEKFAYIVSLAGFLTVGQKAAPAKAKSDPNNGAASSFVPFLSQIALMLAIAVAVVFSNK